MASIKAKGLAPTHHWEQDEPRRNLPYHVDLKTINKDRFRLRARIMQINKKLPTTDVVSQIRMSSEKARIERDLENLDQLVVNTEKHGFVVNDNYHQIPPEHVPKAFYHTLKPVSASASFQHMMGQGISPRQVHQINKQGTSPMRLSTLSALHTDPVQLQTTLNSTHTDILPKAQQDINARAKLAHEKAQGYDAARETRDLPVPRWSERGMLSGDTHFYDSPSSAAFMLNSKYSPDKSPLGRPHSQLASMAPVVGNRNQTERARQMALKHLKKPVSAPTRSFATNSKCQVM